METVSDLRSFAGRAERNPEEAFRLFRSEEFRKLIPSGDHRAAAMWRGLSAPPVNPSQMEEFLVGMDLKDIVEVAPDEQSAAHWSVTDSVQETLTLRKVGKGCFSFRVSTDSDFLELPRSTVTENDFVGSTCEFAYLVNASRLGRGVRRGVIRFEAPCRSFTFAVSASRSAAELKLGNAEVDRNLAAMQMLRLSYQLDRISRAEYISASLRCIEAHYCSSTKSLASIRLYQAYLEKLKGNEADAAAILREFPTGSFEDEETEIELACLYLRGVLGEGKVPAGKVAAKVRSRFERDGDSYILLKLLFLTNPDIGRYPRRRKKAALQVFERGCTSPLLYAELIRDLRQDDALLVSLDDLMVQTLLFAAKQDLLTEPLALRTAYLSANEKCFSEPLLRVLKTAYDKWPADGILEAIVRLLMKGQPRDSGCFPWYELAVERGIKVIRLYEYYIETMPDTKRDILPLPLRKYFLYNNTLTEEGQAVVYANILRNARTDPETWEAYRKKAEEFAYESLSRGRVGENYAVLYQAFIRSIRDEQSARTLSKLLFTCRIYCEDKDVRSVQVVHDGLKQVLSVPLIRGSAHILRYTEDAQILFENAASQRFFTMEAYNISPLSESTQLMDLLRAYLLPDGGFLLHELRRIWKNACRTAREFELWRTAADSDAFTPSLRREARKRVLGFLLENPESSFFHHGTPDEVLEHYAAADRKGLVQVLLGSGLYEKAYRILLEYGTEQIPREQLVRLACLMIEESGQKKDEELLGFTAEVFLLGTYDERMLQYLAEHYRGSMEEMLRIREAATHFYIDTFPLDDRILSLAVRDKLNIAEGPRILKSYVRHGGRQKLIRSYLEFRADAILGLNEPVSDELAACISDLYDREEPIDFAMKLALLRYYSQQYALDAHAELQVDLLMEECVKRNLRFAFMKNLPYDFVRQYRLDDLVFVETKAQPDAEVLITHSLKSRIAGEKAVWKTEPLIHRFRGIFSKEFTLFYGEELNYFLTVREAGTERRSGEEKLEASASSLSGTGSYQRIGRMLRDAEQGDMKALEEEMCSFLKARQVSKALFELEESV